MGQQPNVEIRPEDVPRPEPEPGPPRRWRPGLRPGMITSPQQTPWGGAFGTPGPDAGFALKMLGAAELPDRSPLLERVLAALMAARASLFGRAPIKDDLEVSMLLAGLSDDSPADLTERRKRWLEAAAHETYPGRVAVAEIGPDLLRLKPDQLLRRLSPHP